jgi:ribosomal RNA-processing protein 8
MGTNFPEFIKEANRVLKPNGKLLVAEVLSRFSDVNKFVKHMKDDMGFKALKINKLKNFFYVMVFEKIK